MLDTFTAAVLAGTILGMLSGLGVGGGSLLILWLTLVLQVPHETAQNINLMFFIPCAVIACLFRLRQGKLVLRDVFPALAAGIFSAILFMLLSRQFDTDLLRKPFGVLLLITGLRELLYRPRKAR